MGEFKAHTRSDGKRPDRLPLITLRTGAIAFNAAFVRAAEIEKMERASVLVDEEDSRLGFRFHNNVSDSNSYAVTRDGGGRGAGRVIQCQSLIQRHSWISGVARLQDKGARRFAPDLNRSEKAWVISLSPAFDVEVPDKKSIASNLRGVYRYLNGDEVVYIGRGAIRSRAGAADREGWIFDRIQYSVVASEQAQIKWESYWIHRHVSTYGERPRYNRILGKSPKKSDT